VTFARQLVDFEFWRSSAVVGILKFARTRTSFFTSYLYLYSYFVHRYEYEF